MKTLLHPQEIETFYIIPTIRRQFAECLKKQGMKQKDIAEILGINSATISQYSSNKRAGKIRFEQEVVTEIQKAAALVSNRLAYIRETQKLLLWIRNSKNLCTIHRQLSDLPKDCLPETIGCGACR